MPKRPSRDPNKAAFDLIQKVIAKNDGGKKSATSNTAKKSKRTVH